MKTLQHWVRLRAYSKRFGLGHLPISLVEACYDRDINLSGYDAQNDNNFSNLKTLLV